MTDLRTAAQQALEALKNIDKEFSKHGRQHWPEAVKARAAIAPLRAALAEPVQEPVAWADMAVRGEDKGLSWTQGHFHKTPLYTAPSQRKPLTIERLRDALVASRIIQPAAVEDPDEYDDGVTLHRIEALHRRLT